MRIYEGAPRQNYEDVLRSIGALLDQRGMREITLNETEDGFIIQGLALVADEERPWNDPAARLRKETVVLREDDLARFMEEAVARRRPRGAPAAQNNQAFYEPALRALGVYLDQQQPRDVFFFEQEQQFVGRQAGEAQQIAMREGQAPGRIAARACPRRGLHSCH